MALPFAKLDKKQNPDFPIIKITTMNLNTSWEKC
jgi:hypothetical protein